MADAPRLCPNGSGWKDAWPALAWPGLYGTRPFMPGIGSFSPCPARELSMLTSRNVVPVPTLVMFALPVATCESALSHWANWSDRLTTFGPKLDTTGDPGL